MAIDYAQLALIHGLLQQRDELKGRLNRFPKMVRDLETKRKTVEAARDLAKESLKATKKLAHEKQLTLKQREDRVEQFKLKRNSCETNREYQILNDQIAADIAANSVLADEILEAMEQIERLEQDLKETEQQVAVAQQECQQGVEQLRQRETKLHADLSVVEGELLSAERILTGDIGVRYRRMVESRGAGALSETEGETCGECHQVLTVQTKNELWQQQVIFCKGCGSLMYMSPTLMANPS
ncbi:MAG TPA: hypothetical protein PKD54_10220 [Pirellulaceae bacterium]|nr:hypothetical protein [Pirellulaceae bacterium]